MENMLRAGYMAKRVAGRPAGFQAEGVRDIYSVSGCISENFADYIDFWRHNGYWFFDSPQIIRQLAGEHSIDLAGTRLFYYEAYEREFDDAEDRWVAFRPEPSLKTEVLVPAEKALEGYDVVSFSMKTSAECSPLSCNGLAAEVETNEHCLLDCLERAKELLAEGTFKSRSQNLWALPDSPAADPFPGSSGIGSKGAEPGPYRIFAVYSAGWP